MADIHCDYCESPAHLVTGERVYPHRKDLFRKRFWICFHCNAWVGVHDGTDAPLGRLANKELRRAKMQAHEVFDPIWQRQKKQGVPHREARRGAYKWLASQLGIDVQLCNIGMFDVETCRKVVRICREAHRV